MSENKLIVVFGASGRTGREVVQAALDAGMRVRAALRDGDHAPLPAGTEKVKCDILNEREVESVLVGAGAVMVVFGPMPPYTDIFCAKATELIVRTMERAGVRRLICQTGGMVGDYPKNRTALFGLFSALFTKKNPKGAEDRLLQEKAIIGSTLDWTIIKPPRLTDKETSGHLEVGKDVKVGMLSSVSRKSIAKFIMSELGRPAHIKEAVFLKE